MRYKNAEQVGTIDLEGGEFPHLRVRSHGCPMPA